MIEQKEPIMGQQEKRIDQARVMILLASWNGASHISEQLESIAAQTHANWRLVVSDDGSGDDTCELVRAFAERFPKGQVRLIKGPKAGRCEANFMSLLQREAGHADKYIAYCDQDDIWVPEKLTRGILALSVYGLDKIALYGSRTQIVSEDLSHLGFSPRFKRRPTFRNALVQSIAGGNTQIMTPAAARLLHETSFSVPSVVMHDWWSYMLVAAAGGEVIYDPEPTVLYRQHDGNVIGRNSGMKAQMARVRAMWQGRMKAWNEINLTALLSVQDYISDEAKETIERFRRLRELRGFQAVSLLREIGLYRQTRSGQVALYVAAFFRKL